MKITRRTKTRDILPLLTKERLDDLLQQVDEVPLRKPLLSMTIGEFGDIVEDEEGFLLSLVKRNRRALRFLGRLKSYRSEMDGLNKFIKRFDIEQSKEEKAAAKGVLFPNMSQRMLLTCCKFFGLGSFRKAEKCKVSEYLTIFQDEASSVVFQRKYNKIIEAKYKAKNKKK